ncbi:MAG: 30S ribosomal protein S7 [Candidatus Pacebacteria bacterium]|jgi:small subunit ribosomal protein S7|nr:30S ribosomal protein S7 [Candidatus Paceibacterota bacterium]
MRRKHRTEKQYEPDLVYKNPEVTRFINYLMKDGEKSVARQVFYKAMNIIEEQSQQDPLKVFELAVANTTPELEITTRRIGGANYQIPRPVPEFRKTTLAFKWLIAVSRSKKGKSMAARLAEEIINASKGEGSAVKKKLDTERMAEANRAFASMLKK